MKYVYEFMSLCFALSEMCFALTVRHGVFGSIFIDYTVAQFYLLQVHCLLSFVLDSLSYVSKHKTTKEN